MRSGTVDREERVLDLWERAVGLDRWQRDEALLAAGQAPPRGLGARNAALLALRNALFDGALALKSACPACAAECEFQVDSASLAGELGDQAAERAVTFDWHGLSLSARPPTIDDLHAVSRQANQASAVRVLLARCLVGNFDSGDFDPATADDATIEELGRRIERLDPGAVVSFDLRCPACAHDWSAMLDVGEALWTELQRAAERTLTEIDALARAYGWTETEVMRLSPTRRAAYLQLVEGT
jgi:hypothetical protein